MFVLKLATKLLKVVGATRKRASTCAHPAVFPCISLFCLFATTNEVFNDTPLQSLSRSINI